MALVLTHAFTCNMMNCVAPWPVSMFMSHTVGLKYQVGELIKKAPSPSLFHLSPFWCDEYMMSVDGDEKG